MNIRKIIIPAYVLDKLYWKHHVSEEEVYEILYNHPRIEYMEAL